MAKLVPFESRNAFKRYLNLEYRGRFKDKYNYPIGNYGRWLYENNREAFEKAFELWSKATSRIDSYLHYVDNVEGYVDEIYEQRKNDS